jgi:prevent-host-death family protein
MTKITASRLREDLASTINKVAFGRERIILQRNGKDVAALVSIEDLTLLRKLEDRLDLADMNQAIEEPGANIRWEDAKKALGM